MSSSPCSSSSSPQRSSRTNSLIDDGSAELSDDGDSGACSYVKEGACHHTPDDVVISCTEEGCSSVVHRGCSGGAAPMCPKHVAMSINTGPHRRLGFGNLPGTMN